MAGPAVINPFSKKARNSARLQSPLLSLQEKDIARSGEIQAVHLATGAIQRGPLPRLL